MPIPVFRQATDPGGADAALRLDTGLVARWLVRFLHDECTAKRGIGRAVIGLSGGVDSAVVAYLSARAFGPENVTCFRMPFRLSSPDSLDHAGLVVDALGVNERTIDITKMVDGYAAVHEVGMSDTRLGNVCARCRTVVLFDQSAKLGALPIGTGNKTERFFGYFTLHADDAPPINPLGDLFKTQVWDLAREMGVPEVIVKKAPTADLVKGQTDEGDFGISYLLADRILIRMLRGWSDEKLVGSGFEEKDVRLVRHKVSSTHWKRHLPTVAMLSDTSVHEYYLRPVDYQGVER
jgi:NAD+ synthase